MPAHPVIVSALVATKSLSQLQEAQIALADVALNPDRVTGNQLDGVSWSFQPSSLSEVTHALENVEAAIAELSKAKDDPDVTDINGRFLDLSTRPIR